MSDHLRQYRDDVFLILITKVRLNRYDGKFVTNIANNYIFKKRPLTEKQSEVFDTIVRKYRKQLKTLDINYSDILALPWRHGFFTDKDLTNQSYFKCIDGEMQLNFKFNKEAIAEVRALVYDDKCLFLNKNRTAWGFGDNEKYNFVWDKANGMWRGKFNVHLFHTLTDFAKKHRIRLDKSVTDIMQDANDQFGSECLWETQLHLVNDRLYINNIAETMLNTLDHFNFEDTSDINIENICTTLCIKPLVVYTKNRSKLMSFVPSTPFAYNTNTKDSQDELYNYLKSTGKKVVFYLASKSKLLNSLSNNATKSDFITKTQMKEWDIDYVILQYSYLNYSISEYTDCNHCNTIVTTLDIETLVQSAPEIGKIALNNKFIRIK